MAIRLMSYRAIVMLSHVRERAKQYRDEPQGARQKGSKSHPAWMITFRDLIDGDDKYDNKPGRQLHPQPAF
eukprot:7771573-Pyramimonas_sp.AAC.1